MKVILQPSGLRSVNSNSCQVIGQVVCHETVWILIRLLSQKDAVSFLLESTLVSRSWSRAWCLPWEPLDEQTFWWTVKLRATLTSLICCPSWTQRFSNSDKFSLLPFSQPHHCPAQSHFADFLCPDKLLNVWFSSGCNCSGRPENQILSMQKKGAPIKALGVWLLFLHLTAFQ